MEHFEQMGYFGHVAFTVVMTWVLYYAMHRKLSRWDMVFLGFLAVGVRSVLWHLSH